MRRKYFGLAIAAFALLQAPSGWAGDNEIAEQIIEKLQQDRKAGHLKGFDMKLNVSEGVVSFVGKVVSQRQKDLVLAAADGVEGISKVVDQMDVQGVAAVTPQDSAADAGFDMSAALASAAPVASPTLTPSGLADSQDMSPNAPVMPVANVESVDDQAVVNDVLGALRQAKASGQLRDFGVDVKSQAGRVELVGQASSAAQRQQILAIVQGVPGVGQVRESISIAAAPARTGSAASLSPAPLRTAATPISNAGMSATVSQAPYRTGGTMARPAAMQGDMMGAPMMGTPTMGAPMMGSPVGTPVPMGPSAAVGAPRYDTPNLPNYAWPGYSAYPNYAAVTYPQQYSPSAWPYIGPFYPYPQVPLGWRKVSLEWDDGWWYLDFTDRDY